MEKCVSAKSSMKSEFCCIGLQKHANNPCCFAPWAIIMPRLDELERVLALPENLMLELAADAWGWCLGLGWRWSWLRTPWICLRILVPEKLVLGLLLGLVPGWYIKCKRQAQAM